MRIDRNSARVVDEAIEISEREGVAAAIDFLYRHNIRKDVALRVMASPLWQRKCRRRQRMLAGPG